MKANDLLNQARGSKKMSSDLLRPEAPTRQTIQVPGEVHKRLRELAYKNNKPIYQIITEALDDAGR